MPNTSVDIKVWSDFVCPFCMIAEKPLLDAAQESGVDVAIEWMPFELRPYPTPTLRPEDEYLQKVWPQAVYPLAEQYGVNLKLPSVSPQPHTELAWEGYLFAQEWGKAIEYNLRMFEAFFQEDQDIGEIDVLTRLATEVGLDQFSFRQALERREYRQTHQRLLRQAQALGVTAVPTTAIGARLFAGVQPKEVLVSAIREERPKVEWTVKH